MFFSREIENIKNNCDLRDFKKYLIHTEKSLINNLLTFLISWRAGDDVNTSVTTAIVFYIG